MLKLESIKLSPGHGPEALAAEAARILRIPRKDILSLRILRRSVDAREEARRGGLAVLHAVPYRNLVDLQVLDCVDLH